MKYLCLSFVLLFSFQLTGQFDSNEHRLIKDLKEATREPLRVFQLDLSDQGLTEIPKVISTFKNLRLLNLSNNSIYQMNDALSNLRELQILKLTNNRLSVFDFSKISGSSAILEEIYLRGNILRKIDQSIQDFQQIRVLDLGRNKIAQIDNELYLKNLRWLHLDANELKILPSLAVSSKLDMLNINDNQITEFTLDERFQKLERLDIGNNPIEDFKIKKLKYKMIILILDWIDLSQNSLSYLPQKLEGLSMEHCSLNSFPESIRSLKKLKEISVMHNSIELFDFAKGDFPKIKKFWTGGNDFDEKSLEHLDQMGDVIHLAH